MSDALDTKQTLEETAAARPADKSGTFDQDAGTGTAIVEPTKKGEKGPETPNEVAVKPAGKITVKEGVAPAKRPADKATGEGDAEAKPKAEPAEKGPQTPGEEEGKVVKAKIEEAAEFSLDDELGALLESSEMSEEFQSKAKAIFEAAVTSTAAAHVTSIQEAAYASLTESVAKIEADLREHAESYLADVAEKYMSENAEEIESNAIVETARSLLEGIVQLVEDHNIELPADKKDVYEESLARETQLEEALADALDSEQTLKESLAVAQKDIALREFTEDLTVTQGEKIRALAEGVEFGDVDSFNVKLGVLKENYLDGIARETTGPQASADLITEDANTDGLLPADRSSDVDPIMASYVNGLSNL